MKKSKLFFKGIAVLACIVMVFGIVGEVRAVVTNITHSTPASGVALSGITNGTGSIIVTVTGQANSETLSIFAETSNDELANLDGNLDGTSNVVSETCSTPALPSPSPYTCQATFLITYGVNTGNATITIGSNDPPTLHTITVQVTVNTSAPAAPGSATSITYAEPVIFVDNNTTNTIQVTANGDITVSIIDGVPSDNIATATAGTLANGIVPVSIQGHSDGYATLVLTGAGGVTKSISVVSGSPKLGTRSGTKIGQACESSMDCSETNKLVCVNNDDYNSVVPDDRKGACIGSNNARCGDNQEDLFSVRITDLDVYRNLRCQEPLVCKAKHESDYTEAYCSQAFGGDIAQELGLGETSRDIRDIARQGINIFLSFLGIIGVVIVIYGGILWMTARGNDEQVEKAKKTLIAGVIGILIVAVAWTITSYALKIGEKLT